MISLSRGHEFVARIDCKTHIGPRRAGSDRLLRFCVTRYEVQLSEDAAALRKRVTELESALTTAVATLAKVTAERDKLRRAYEQLKGHLDLLRRRIFLAQAERIDTEQLELEFAETKAKLDKLSDALGAAAAVPSGTPEGTNDGGSEKKRPHGKSPTGRRKLAEEDMPEERVVIEDPSLEGVAERIGFEESYKLGRRQGGPVRIVMARVTYKVTPDGELPRFVTAALPKEIMASGLLAPSLVAHILTKKFRFGMPFTRLVQELASEGIKCDDSTMCRYAEHVGATLGCIVDACAKEARETAFCLSTDATGIKIQPPRHPEGKRQPCTRGHFFVVLADRDHVFFEYQEKHTSEAVCSMFKGFKGYVQADAHCVYDALFRGEARLDPADKAPQEVGCFRHARRKFWEAAVVTKDALAHYAILRLHVLFEFEKQWASLAPKQRHERRQLASRPLLDEFFGWAPPRF